MSRAAEQFKQSESSQSSQSSQSLNLVRALVISWDQYAPIRVELVDPANVFGRDGEDGQGQEQEAVVLSEPAGTLYRRLGCECDGLDFNDRATALLRLGRGLGMSSGTGGEVASYQEADRLHERKAPCESGCFGQSFLSVQGTAVVLGPVGEDGRPGDVLPEIIDLLKEAVTYQVEVAGPGDPQLWTPTHVTLADWVTACGVAVDYRAGGLFAGVRVRPMVTWAMQMRWEDLAHSYADEGDGWSLEDSIAYCHTMSDLVARVVAPVVGGGLRRGHVVVYRDVCLVYIARRDAESFCPSATWLVIPATALFTTTGGMFTTDGLAFRDAGTLTDWMSMLTGASRTLPDSQ